MLGIRTQPLAWISPHSKGARQKINQSKVIYHIAQKTETVMRWRRRGEGRAALSGESGNTSLGGAVWLRFDGEKEPAL